MRAISACDKRVGHPSTTWKYPPSLCPLLLAVVFSFSVFLRDFSVCSFAEMADSREHSSVPSWDGQARTWRRYTREVAWFVQSTPTHKRRYCASKLLAKLSGPARLLAMSWRVSFDDADGTRAFLQRLAGSPLVRKTLPNAAAICAQYFAFRRNPGEGIGNFLVRETLVHEEFVEALIRLHEEKLGLSQEQRDFGLPASEPESWPWWNEYEDEEWQPDEATRSTEDGEAAPTEDRDGDARPDRGVGPTTMPATTGSSPSHRAADGGSRDERAGSQIGDPRPPTSAVDELSLADSFIMGVLRGWRLLQAAGLTAEEKRDILSTTKNSLEYEVVAASLQNLWDEQLLGHRGGGHTMSYNAHYVEQPEDEQLFYQDAGDDWWDSSWWHDDYYADETYDWRAWDEEYPSHAAHVSEVNDDPEGDAKLKEAQQAEQMAEALALEAQRSWSEAQRATQALRKDRGFGAIAGTGAAKCFNCGAPGHLSRDCPDRRHPGGKGRSKGKYKSGYYQDTMDEYMYFVGKGKGKPKGKRSHWLEAQGAWIKGKGKNKGKGKDPYRTVNAYASEYFLGGLEVTHVMEAATTTSPDGAKPQFGMVDCGATASAAPEGVVKGLIQAILEVDKSAHVEFDEYMRPFFRFGDGRWGKALCKVRITSNASGTTKHFELYTLPNPTAYYQSKLDKSTLVPLLVGMDFLGKAGIGLVLDFATGYALNSTEANPQIYRLQVSRKGHYMFDVVQYLTNGCSQDGKPRVVVRTSSTQSPSGQVQLLELGTAWFDMTACDLELDEQEDVAARSRVWQLYEHARESTINNASALRAQMGASLEATIPTISSPSPAGNVAPRAADSGDHEHRGRYQASHACQGEGPTIRSRTSHASGHTRPTSQQGPVAVLRDALGVQGEDESSWAMDPLCGVQPEVGVRPQEGISGIFNKDGEPSNGDKDAGRIGTTDARSATHLGDLLGHAAEDRRRGVFEAPDWTADHQGECRQAEGRDDRQSLNQQLVDGHRDPGRRPGSGLRAGGASSLKISSTRSTTKTTTRPTTSQPLPIFMGKKIMQMSVMMTTMLSGMLMGLHCHDRDGLWEVACAPHSWLSEAATQYGLAPRRINLAEGYDLYDKETWKRLRLLYKERKPRRIWFSLPCTKWCAWTSVNYNTAERKAQLETYRRKERRMLWECNNFIKEVMNTGDEVDVYFEWPWPCYGWKQQPLIDLDNYFGNRMESWLSCRVDGCCYGLKDHAGELFLRKKWLIKTTDERFHHMFRSKLCPGNHQHGIIEGDETVKSSYYPWRMVESIVRFWRQDTVPTRHLQLVQARELPVDGVVQRDDTEDEFDEAMAEELDAEAMATIPKESSIFSANKVNDMAKAAIQRQSFTTTTLEQVLLEARNMGGAVGRVCALRGTQDGVTSFLLGGYSYGAFGGVTARTLRYTELTRYITGFVRKALPKATFTSIMINYNHAAKVHRDVNNMPQTRNYFMALGEFEAGGLWVEGEPPDGQPVVKRRNPQGVLVRGHIVNAKGKFVSLDPKCWHASQKWRGYRIGIAVFTTRMFPKMKASDVQMLEKLGFNLPRGASGDAKMEAFPLEGLSPVNDPNVSPGNDPHVSPGNDPNVSPGNDPNVSPGNDPNGSNSSARRRDLGDDQHVSTEASPMQVPDKVRQAWEAQVAKFHKAAGHPSNRNLAQIVKEAGHEPWKVEVARGYRCPACQSLKSGGTSSGQVPPAATHQQYAAWQAVAIDAGEWVPPGQRIKVKFIGFMDVATKLRVVAPLFTYDFLQMRAESGQDLIRTFSERWLGTFPKPKVVLMDSAKTFVSEQVHEFMSNVNVLVHHSAEKESWAHGTIEAFMQDIKHTASAIFMDDKELDPQVVLQLAVAALNATEYTAGYSANQWAFGSQYSLSDEDIRTFAELPENVNMEYVKLVSARQRAQEIATNARAKRVLTRLANSSVRQPIRTFQTLDLVKVWRKVWPQEQYKGPRGGAKKSGRPHWIGPGRVVFHEMLPHQQPGDHRQHIVWVLVGSQLLRCSVHSVRPVTETERFQYETGSNEDMTKWKSLADVLPRKEYHDLVNQEPDEDERELPQLPEQPDNTTALVPRRRAVQKVTFAPGDYVTKPVRERLQVSGAGDDVAEEGPMFGSDSASSTTAAATRAPPPVNDYDMPESKKAKVDSQKRLKETTWVDMLYQEAEQELQEFDVFQAMDETEEFLRIEMDLEPLSHRQQKMLERNPVAYLVKKMKDSEVQLSRLSDKERELFVRAKAKEVDSFLKNEAVRKCLDDEEVKKAYESNRIVRARWVLTWKLIPPEDRAEALADQRTNKQTLHNKDGTKKAKARIVLLGFQHPNLLDPSFKTASPVQSTLGRNLLYTMAAHHQWTMEGLDLATAFLQTQPTAADQELWTTGVAELRQALGIEGEGIMRILRNIYGSTTAPRGLWLDLHKTLTRLGGQPVLGERCLWIWLSKHQMDGNHPKVIGAMGGHVDDFHRIGEDASEEWLEVKRQIDSAYKWGMAKTGSYRHAGTDICTERDDNGFQKITVDQSYYVETLADVDIDVDRIRTDEPLNKKDVEACRTALGALQWLAIQSQPQLCSRCNLLLTEVVTSGTMSTAREIQAMIGEVRQENFRLEFRKFPQAKHWSELVFISMGDQAHSNRPKGESTGGLVTMVAGPECLQGAICPMSLLAWRTWKLKRRAIGSNDAEVQSILEAEDQNFRTRLLWTELHGAGGSADARPLRDDLVESTERQVLMVRGVLCTDSRGGYDAVELNESPLLGLSNMRAALQAFQLRDNLKRAGCELRWLKSDYDLADALTKKREDSRYGMLKFLRTWHWCIRFDPSFTSAKKSKQQGRSAIGDIDKYLRKGPS